MNADNTNIIGVPRKRRHIALGVLSFLFILSTFSSTLSFVFSDSAVAADNQQSELLNQIKTNLYRNALLICTLKAPLSGGAGFDQNKRISEDEATRLNWFGGNGMNNVDVAAGYMLKQLGSSTVSNSGFVSCSNGKFIKEALGNLGYSSSSLSGIDNVTHLMCDLGFRRASKPSASTSAADCYKSSGDWRRGEVNGDSDSDATKTKLRDTIAAKTKGAVSTLSDAAKYLLYRDSTIGLCRTDGGTKVTSKVDENVGAVIKETTNGQDENDTFYTWGSNRYSYSRGVGWVGEGYSPGFTNYGNNGFDSYDPGNVNVDGGLRNNTVILSKTYFWGEWIVAQKNPCAAMAKEANKYFSKYQSYIKAHPDEAAAIKEETPKKTDQDKPDCDASIGIGWILCPTVNFLAGIGDQAKSFIDQALTVDTFKMFALKSDSNSGQNDSAYNAWKTMRNIANVLFIIAFLFMIYSQITGFGMSNYALKKMLPRLIVVAILINASFYITVAGVEISNVVGHSIDSAMSSMSGCSSGQGDTCIRVSVDGQTATDFKSIATMALGWGLTGVGAAAAVAASLYFFLPTVIAAIVYVAFVAMAAAILLGMRQAIIILLVVVSPIAFAAYLLPNTEGLFKKWWGLLKTMLFLFPIFALLYGGGKIASAVLQGTGQPFMQVIGAASLFVGILALPKLLEGALAVGGISSIVSRFQGKATGATTNKAKQAYDNSTFGNFRKYRQNKAEQRRMAIKSGQFESSKKDPLNRMRNARSAFARKTLPLYGTGYAADVQQRGAEAEDKLWDQKVGNQQKYMSQESYSSAQLMDIVRNKNNKHTAEERAAAAGLVMKNGAMKDIQNLFDETQGMGQSKAVSGIRKQMMQDMNRTPFGFGAGDISEMRLGHAAPAGRDESGNPLTDTDGNNVPRENYDKAINARAESKISDAGWAKFDPDDKQRLVTMAENKQLSDKALQNLVNVTKAAEDNPNIEVSVETREWGEKIRAEAAKKGIVVQESKTATTTEAPTTTQTTTASTSPAAASPTTSRNEGPEINLRGGETTTDSGFIVPRDMK